MLIGLSKHSICLPCEARDIVSRYGLIILVAGCGPRGDAADQPCREGFAGTFIEFTLHSAVCL